MAKRKSKDSSKRAKLIENTIGWYGAFATLTAYLTVSFGILAPRDLTYQFLNLSGALGLGIICYYKRTYQPLFVNIIWAIIALLALVDIIYILH